MYKNILFKSNQKFKVILYLNYFFITKNFKKVGTFMFFTHFVKNFIKYPPIKYNKNILEINSKNNGIILSFHNIWKRVTNCYSKYSNTTPLIKLSLISNYKKKTLKYHISKNTFKFLPGLDNELFDKNNQLNNLNNYTIEINKFFSNQLKYKLIKDKLGMSKIIKIGQATLGGKTRQEIFDNKFILRRFKWDLIKELKSSKTKIKKLQNLKNLNFRYQYLYNNNRNKIIRLRKDTKKNPIMKKLTLKLFRSYKRRFIKMMSKTQAKKMIKSWNRYWVTRLNNVFYLKNNQNTTTKFFKKKINNTIKVKKIKTLSFTNETPLYKKFVLMNRINKKKRRKKKVFFKQLKFKKIPNNNLLPLNKILLKRNITLLAQKTNNSTYSISFPSANITNKVMFDIQERKAYWRTIFKKKRLFLWWEKKKLNYYKNKNKFKNRQLKYIKDFSTFQLINSRKNPLKWSIDELKKSNKKKYKKLPLFIKTKILMSKYKGFNKSLRVIPHLTNYTNKSDNLNPINLKYKNKITYYKKNIKKKKWPFKFFWFRKKIKKIKFNIELKKLKQKSRYNEIYKITSKFLMKKDLLTSKININSYSLILYILTTKPYLLYNNDLYRFPKNKKNDKLIHYKKLGLRLFDFVKDPNDGNDDEHFSWVTYKIKNKQIHDSTFPIILRFLEDMSGCRLWITNTQVHYFGHVRTAANHVTIFMRQLNYFYYRFNRKIQVQHIVKVLHIALVTQDLELLRYTSKYALARLRVWQQRSYFQLINQALKYYFSLVFDLIGVKGFHYEVKGKIGMKGKTRKKKIQTKLMKSSRSNYKYKVIELDEVFSSDSGALSFKLSVYY